MSYILDALKKSERDRQQGNAPDVYSQHAEPIEQRSPWFWLLLLAIIIILLIVIGMWVFDEPKETNAVINIPKIDKPIVSNSPVASYPTTTKNIKPIMPRAPFRDQPASNKQRSDNVAKHVSNDGVLNIHQLPESERKYIPAIKISAHLYSSKAGKGMVMVNGQSLHIGDTLPSGLMLESISKKHVVFSYKDSQFSIGVFEAWQP
ncbi:MAG: general secretion pathway protein GspB [Mariprofundales bacterium]